MLLSAEGERFPLVAPLPFQQNLQMFMNFNNCPSLFPEQALPTLVPKVNGSFRWNQMQRLWAMLMVLLMAVAMLGSPAEAQAQRRKTDQWEDEIVPAGRYIFRWGLMEGQVLDFELTQDTVTTSKIGLVDSGEVPFNLKMTQRWVVEERNKDTATVLQTFRGLSLRFKHPTVGDISADTNQPVPELPVGKQIHQNLLKFVGKQMRMKIDKLGVIKSLEVVNSSDVETDEGVGQQFSPKQLRSIFSQIAVFKTLTYKPGDSWHIDHKIKNGPLEAQLDLEYEFQSVGEDEKLATVALKPLLTLTKDTERVSIDSQSGHGTLSYSLENKQVLETQLHQELQLNIKHDDPKNPPLIQTVKTDTSVKFKLLENQPIAEEPTSDEEPGNEK